MGNVTALLNTDGALDLFCKQGKTWKLFLTLKTPSGTPVNITGYTFVGQFRAAYGAAAKYSWTCNITDGAAGKLAMTITASVTAAVAAYRDNIDPAQRGSYAGAGVYVHELKMIDLSGEVTGVFDGKLYVDPEV